MKQRFKKYLEREFRKIAPTKEASEYKEEVLSNLLDKAQELKIKGIEDEDMIFNMCIENLGDFDLTLTEFERKRVELSDTAKKTGITMIFLLTTFLFIAIAYLVVSFVTKAWSQSWLIFIAGALGFVISLTIIRSPKLLKQKNYIIFKLYLTASIVMVTVFVYLSLLMLTSLPYLWLAFLVMPIIITITITIISIITKSKLKFLELSLTIMTTTSLIYVILGILGIIAWAWGWLIPVCGAFVVCLMFTIMLIIYRKNKIMNEQTDNIE